MQPTRPVSFAAILRVLVMAVVVGACSSSNPIPLPGATGPLLTVTTRGGECPGAPCGSSVIVERDGHVHQAAKPPNDLGQVPAQALTALVAAINATDYRALRARPFTGDCPTTFDGQAYLFEFGAPGGTQRIDSCEVAIDFGTPLFVAVSTALGPFLALPTT